MVTSLSAATTVIPPTGGCGMAEEPPPQAVKMSAAANAINETRIECKNMNFSCTEQGRPQILSDFNGDIAKMTV
jgi:hypothetical protein